MSYRSNCFLLEFYNIVVLGRLLRDHIIIAHERWQRYDAVAGENSLIRPPCHQTADDPKFICSFFDSRLEFEGHQLAINAV